jgi:hypothetical protein
VAATIWLFAKEFGWSKDYILWDMGEAELFQLEHAILINKGIEVRRRTKNADQILDKILS